MKVLVTCPPMLGKLNELEDEFTSRGIDVAGADVIQTLSENELIELVPEYDGWIIGDDPATHKVFEAARKGKLKAAVKWGIGVDNVDFIAARELDIPITNTPGMFGDEVADVGMSYLIGLARGLYFINDEVKKGNWPKPCGISLKGKTVGLVGFGDIGKNFARRAIVSGMSIVAYDPKLSLVDDMPEVEVATWPERLGECDFVVFTCSLNEKNRHMFNRDIVGKLKNDVRIVNIARGSLISEDALIFGLETGVIHSVALDVFENEPLPNNSELRKYNNCIFGSHNASNTYEAVMATSRQAIQKLFDFLGVQ